MSVFGKFPKGGLYDGSFDHFAGKAFDDTPAPILEEIKRMDPLLLQSLGVFLLALCAGHPSTKKQHAAEQKRARERIRRAERGVKTRRKNAKKKVGGVKKASPAKGRPIQKRNCRTLRCVRHGSHVGMHRNALGAEWPPSPRVSKKPARPKTKPNAPSPKKRSKKKKGSKVK